MKRLVRAAAILALCATAQAMVVRPAPDFSLADTPRPTSLRSLRGQSVVLVIGRDARVKDFRRMVYRLRWMYSQFATEKVLFVAAIENGPAEVPSDIPFALAANPAKVANDYGVTGKYALAVIGVDGNLDLITDKVVSPERVRDVAFNNYESQAQSRKGPSF